MIKFLAKIMNFIVKVIDNLNNFLIFVDRINRCCLVGLAQVVIKFG